MARIYLNLGDTGNALSTMRKCLIIGKEAKNPILKAHLLHNIGTVLFYRGDSAGLTDIKQALEIRRKLNDKNGIVNSCITLANLFVKHRQNKEADVYIKEAEKYLPAITNVRNEALYYNMMGRRHANNPDQSIKYFEKAIVILKGLNAGTDLEESLQSLISTYGDNPKYASAKLRAYELLETVSAKLNKANIQKLIMQQKYDEQLQIRQAMFQVEEKIHEEKNNSEKKRRDLYMAGILLILAITIVYSFFLFKAVRKIRKNNIIISEQKQEVEKQKQLVEEKHKDITDSINYAQRIQSALILSEQSLSRHFKEAFVLFKPRDIVSGDFYWFTEHEGKKIVALADCTGHGVPGAFMSMIGITLLNQIVNEKGITSPAQILTQLRKEVIRALSTDASGKQDGMDMAIISIHRNEIVFAGANSKALIFNNGAFTELMPDKQPIGNYEMQTDFTEQRITLENAAKIYLFSDGIVDQFGGNRAEKNLFGKKLKIKQLKEWIISTSGLTLSAQKNVIAQKLEEWKNGFEQTDDISLIGIKLS
jgi:serine phosphatase RsbU (regulator of sigma subunit)